jgi:DNA-binding response OmpR family regulator/Flp pilus assembly protein TadD
MLSVLLVDDEKMLVDVTRLFLERFGDMKVVTAGSATEAMAELTKHKFDAMVVDYDMPGINGIELLKIIRAKGDTTPVIIFTGVGREHAAIEALNNGADFFIQKGDNPNSQLRNMVHMIRQAVERRYVGTGLGFTQKILADVVAFFPVAAFVIDRDGRVIAWNEAMTDLTSLPAKDIVGKGDGEYSLPFFGRRSPMLVDLIFKDDEEIGKNNYTLVKRDQSTIIAWTKGMVREGTAALLWMKATALFDSKGVFVAAIGIVRDVTDEMGAELLDKPLQIQSSQPSAVAAPSTGGMFDKILGKAKALHREGLLLSYREGKYREAIELFDRAIEIDPTIAFAWHDRGVCFRELRNDEEALRCFDRAVDLGPDVEEILFTRAELLKKIGILQGKNSALEAAVRVYNRVLELNPNNADAWNSLAIVVKEMGKGELSRQYFDRARELKLSGKNRKDVRKIDML